MGRADQVWLRSLAGSGLLALSKRVYIMSEFPGLSQEWIDDCRRWRGMVLNGRFAHWCADWDDLPVDEITPEWPSCTCFRDDPPVQMAFHFNHFRYTVFYYIHNPAQPEVF